MRYVPPSTSAKIITVLDAGVTLAIEQLGFMFRLPAYDPLIIGTVVGSTYILLKHRDTISGAVVDVSDQVANKLRNGFSENTWKYK